MSAGDSSPTKRSSGVVLAVLVAVSGAGLFVVGLRATGAEEDRARLRARDILAGAELALVNASLAALRQADLAAGSFADDDPMPPGISAVFLSGPDGGIRIPELKEFPAVAPPPADDAERVRRYLEAADEEMRASGDPKLALPFVETVLGDFAHPDLVATLLDRAADLYLLAKRPERALFLSTEVVENLPAARDLEGSPLAPVAHLRILRILRESGDERALVSAASTFARRLGDGAWRLPATDRELMLERIGELLGDAGLPEDVRARIEFLDGLRSRVIPEALDRTPATADDAWRHLVRAGPGRREIYGFRRLAVRDRPHLFGYRLDGAAFSRHLAAAAGEIAGRQGARVEIGLVPPVRAGTEPADSPLALVTDLGGELKGIPVRIAVPAPGSLSLLRTLHLMMTVLFAGALGLGVVLSVRAVRREWEAARIRQRLVDNVSHELRTPLTTIRMYAEMLADEEGVSDDKKEAWRGRILSEAERLSRLVDDVLDLSRGDRGESALRPRSILPGEVAREAVELAAPLAKERGFRVDVEVPDSLPEVHADRDAAVRALVNLLENAIRYSGDAREIEMDGVLEGDRVLIRVADRGPGVPEEARKRLFDRFYRAPRDAGAARGAGLGLALAREVSRAQGGDVLLLDTSSAGSRFALALPVAGGRA